jgi:tRNA nucleotidyltransferase (CCA-adding enzyme)
LKLDYRKLEGISPKGFSTEREYIDALLKNDIDSRDFTINSMYLSVSEIDFSKSMIENKDRIIDLKGGRKDLANKVLNETSRERTFTDPTRYIRCIRFKNKYGFEYGEWVKQ